MVDFVPFPGMASTDNNTQYPANQVMITGNSGTVTATGSMVIVPSTSRIGVGTDNPLGPFDANVNVSFRQGFTTQNTAVVSSLVSNGTITTNAFVANTITSNGTIQAAGTATVNALVSNIFGRFGQNLQVIGSNASINSTTGAFLDAGGAGIAGNLNVGGTVSTFTGAVGIGTASGVGIATTPYSSNLWIYGNVVLANTSLTSSGVIFPDGTRQTSAAANTPSYGPAGTIQVAGAGNTLTGDGSNFFWDNTNKRLGIGTSTPAYLFSLYGTDYVLFNNRPGAAARQEITVGNVIGYGSVLGYDPSIGQSIGYLRRGDSSATSPAITWAYVSSNYRVGINAITQPQNTMDIAGAVAIGSSYSGFAVMTNTNGLSVQGSVGIGTFTPTTNASNQLTLFNATAAGIELATGGATPGGGNIIGVNGGGLTISTFTGGVGTETYAERMRVNSNGAVTMSTPLVIGSGGTGQGTVPTSGQLLIGNGTDYTLATLTQSTGVTITNGVGSISIAIGQAVATTSSVRFNAIGVNTAASATAGTILATNEITAYSSDGRLKENVELISDPLQKVLRLRGVTFDWKNSTKDLGFEPVKTHDVGVIAQEVQAVLPEAVRPAPFDTDSDGSSKSGENYLTVQYEKLTALLIEAVKAQQTKIDELEARLSTVELDPWQ